LNDGEAFRSAEWQPSSGGDSPKSEGGFLQPWAAKLDGDMPQYIMDNTNDEFSHASFLKNYLNSKGVETADLSKFFKLAFESSVPASRKSCLSWPRKPTRRGGKSASLCGGRRGNLKDSLPLG